MKAKDAIRSVSTSVWQGGSVEARSIFALV